MGNQSAHIVSLDHVQLLPGNVLIQVPVKYWMEAQSSSQGGLYSLVRARVIAVGGQCNNLKSSTPHNSHLKRGDEVWVREKSGYPLKYGPEGDRKIFVVNEWDIAMKQLVEDEFCYEEDVDYL